MRIDRVKMVACMTERDLTLKRLAELSGVSRLTLSQVKSGKACSPATGAAIADALGVPLSKIEVAPYAV